MFKKAIATRIRMKMAARRDMLRLRRKVAHDR